MSQEEMTSPYPSGDQEKKVRTKKGKRLERKAISPKGSLFWKILYSKPVVTGRSPHSKLTQILHWFLDFQQFTAQTEYSCTLVLLSTTSRTSHWRMCTWPSILQLLSHSDIHESSFCNLHRLAVLQSLQGWDSGFMESLHIFWSSDFGDARMQQRFWASFC